eukprot:TRINITY_DN4555_c0_g1_i9.p1 TRINITY_DN4555_c0_g1~~TRINITY_DN4555_c0_g1_i9.p1  ORF type:complete len:929 (+),score=271.98 TRINITY_DN4555_c0_g1_i9:86-2872(+)
MMTFTFFFFLMIRRPPRSTLSSSSAASDVYKRQGINAEYGDRHVHDMVWSTGSHCASLSSSSTYTYTSATNATHTHQCPAQPALAPMSQPALANWQFTSPDPDTVGQEPVLYGYISAAPAPCGKVGKIVVKPGFTAAAAAPPAAPPAAASKSSGPVARSNANPLALLSALRSAGSSRVTARQTAVTSAVRSKQSQTSSPVSLAAPKDYTPDPMQFEEAQAVAAYLAGFDAGDDADLKHHGIILSQTYEKIAHDLGKLACQLDALGGAPAKPASSKGKQPAVGASKQPAAAAKQPAASAAVSPAWAAFIQSLSVMPFKDACNSLNDHLAGRTFMASRNLDDTDHLTHTALSGHNQAKFDDELEANFPHLHRWYTHCSALCQGKKTAAAQGGKASAASNSSAPAESSNPLDVLKPLPNAVDGKVVTRFPPEPSGYLHLGHVKACLLNDGYARKYNGKLIFRLDDTNPDKEEQEFADSMIEDLALLGIKPDQCTATSDWFDELLAAGIKFIKEGLAYCDKTPQEKMQEERFDGIESAFRNNSIEENMRLFDEMCKGSDEGLTCCVRAKMGMHHKNKALRDPVYFRCKQAVHHRLGDKWKLKIFPTYDFACPLVDSWEGVTHALRDSNYTDRDLLYTWVADAAKIRCPDRAFFSRLNFVYTELSKRKLGKLVQKGLVRGWDDPRMPTVKGCLNRGMSVPGLRQFMYEQASSMNITLQEWDKIWATNKQCIDGVVPRYTVVEDPVLVQVSGDGCPSDVELRSQNLHPKNPEVGQKVRRYNSAIWIDRADSQSLKEGQEITLVDWGNCKLSNLSGDNITGQLNLSGDVKKTAKVTWVAAMKDTVPCILVTLDHLLDKKELEDGDEIEDCLREDSWTERTAVGEHAMKLLKKGDKMQIMRKGYFICHRPYVNDATPAMLIEIPDGKIKKTKTGTK